MNLTTHKKITHPKRKREYLPLAYAIRKSNARNVFIIQSVMSAMFGAVQLSTIQSQRILSPADKLNKALQIVESVTNTAESISTASKKLQKVY